MVTCDHNDIRAVVLCHHDNAYALKKLVAVRYMRRASCYGREILNNAWRNRNHGCWEEIVFYSHCELALSTLRFIARYVTPLARASSDTVTPLR